MWVVLLLIDRVYKEYLPVLTSIRLDCSFVIASCTYILIFLQQFGCVSELYMSPYHFLVWLTEEEWLWKLSDDSSITYDWINCKLPCFPLIVTNYDLKFLLYFISSNECYSWTIISNQNLINWIFINRNSLNSHCDTIRTDNMSNFKKGFHSLQKYSILKPDHYWLLLFSPQKILKKHKRSNSMIPFYSVKLIYFSNIIFKNFFWMICFQIWSRVNRKENTYEK